MRHLFEENEETQGLVFQDSQHTHQTHTNAFKLGEHTDGQTTRRKHFFYLLCFSAVITSVISLSLLARRSVSASIAPIPTLRRPNQYINLDKIWNSTQTHPPVLNFPDWVFQADRTGKLSEDDKGRSSMVGAVYPHDRHIRVSSQVKTVIHFRHFDFGMEDCVLRYHPPAEQASDADSSRLGTIAVLALGSTPNAAIPSPWRPSPGSLQLLGSFDLFNPATSDTRHFPCPSNEFTTVEFACSALTPDCDVDFWQTKLSHQPSGIVLVQYSSAKLLASIG